MTTARLLQLQIVQLQNQKFLTREAIERIVIDEMIERLAHALNQLEVTA